MEKLTLIQNDPWLKPYSDAIEGRYHRTIEKEKTLTCGGKQTLAEFASGYLYFGLHRTEDGWVFREWAPHATAIYLIGTFNGWEKNKSYRLKPLDNGNWEIVLPAAALHHEDLYKC